MRFSFIITVVLFFFSTFLKGAEIIKLKSGKLYNAQVMNNAEESLMIKDLASKGKNVVFTFFADWCLPCHAELDSLNRLAEKFRLLYNTEIVAVAIDAKDNVKRIEEFVKDKKLKFKVVYDISDEAKNNYQIYALPYTMVVGTNGKIVYSSQGFSKEKFDMLKLVLNEIKYY